MAKEWVKKLAPHVFRSIALQLRGSLRPVRTVAYPKGVPELVFGLGPPSSEGGLGEPVVPLLGPKMAKTAMGVGIAKVVGVEHVEKPAVVPLEFVFEAKTPGA